MMNIYKNILLHLSMIMAAVAVLVMPPVLDSLHPSLKFQPMIATMEGTSKEQHEKIMTISHALNGNAIFFLGASEVSWSKDEPFAIYNFFNNELHIPTVAYGGAQAESMVHYSLLSRFKDNISNKSKIVLLVSPDNFYRKKIPLVAFTHNIPETIFEPLQNDRNVAPLLKGYLQSSTVDSNVHLPLNQLRYTNWSAAAIKKELIYEFELNCEMVKGFYKKALHNEDDVSDKQWPQKLQNKKVVDWNEMTLRALKLNELQHIEAATHWTKASYFEHHKTKTSWNNPSFDNQGFAFEKLIQLVQERHAQVIVIIESINPWAIEHVDSYKQIDKQLVSILNKYNVTYYDMYAQPYQNGWSRDSVHPSDLAWVAMDKFIYENFK